MRIQGKRILVTGGAGFIGANLCEDLAKDNEVLAFDNLATGKRENLNLAIERGAGFIEGDIRDFKALCLAMEGVDYVLHHAALGSVPRSIDNPLASHDVNTTGFLNVLLAARDTGVKRVVYASSSSVYGDHPALPKQEPFTGEPLSPYAVTKQMGEKYAALFPELYGHPDLIGLRYFNVFGKYQNPEGAYAAAIPKFIRAFIRHEPPVVFGDGSQSRDFTYVQNVVHANHCALLAAEGSAQHRIYNVACHRRYTLNDLLGMIQTGLSHRDKAVSRIAICKTDPRPGDVQHSLADIRKIEQELSYKPLFDLESGLAASLDWYWQSLGGSQELSSRPPSAMAK